MWPYPRIEQSVRRISVCAKGNIKSTSRSGPIVSHPINKTLARQGELQTVLWEATGRSDPDPCLQQFQFPKFASVKARNRRGTRAVPAAVLYRISPTPMIPGRGETLLLPNI